MLHLTKGDLCVVIMIAFASGVLAMDVARDYQDAKLACVRPVPSIAPLICEHYRALGRACPKGIKS